MKKVLGVLTAFMIGIGSSFVEAANIKDFPRVAVMNFGNKAVMSRGLRAHDFSSASEYAIFQLANSGWFDLVDYEQLSTIAKMHSVNMSGLVDPATAVAMGKFAGAEFMVIGNVTGLTVKENVFGYQHGGKASVGNAQHVVTANVAMRIVDIETGRIVAAGLGKGSSTSTHTELSFTKYRNRKVETEDISDTITKDIVDEYTKNKSSSKTSKSSKDKSTTSKDEKTKIDTKSSNKDIENSVIHDLEETVTDNTREQNTITEDKNETSDLTKSNVKKYGSVTNIKGDANGDGLVDELDFEIVEAKIVGLEVDPPFIFENADVDGSGDLTTNDASQIKMHITGQKKLENNPSELLLTNTDESVVSTDGISKNLQNVKDNEVNKGKSITKKDTTSLSEKMSDSIGSEEAATSGTENVVTENYTAEQNDSTDETFNKANNENRVTTTNKSIYYERETEDYVVTIGTVEVSDIQVRNAISKAVRDAVYGKTGLMTVLNGGKQLKIKTGF